MNTPPPAHVFEPCLKSKPEPGPTDRDCIIALFNLVGALAEKLTGERPTVRLRFGERGENFVGTGGGWDVTWEKAASNPPGPPRE